MRIEGVRAAYGGMEVTPPHLAVLVGQAARPDLGGPDFLALNCPGARAVGGRRQSEQPAVLSVGHTVVDSGDLVLRCACIIVIVQRVDPLNATHRRLGCNEVGGEVRPVIASGIGGVAAVVVGDAVARRHGVGEGALRRVAQQLVAVPVPLGCSAVGGAPVDVDVCHTARGHLTRERGIADPNARCRVCHFRSGERDDLLGGLRPDCFQGVAQAQRVVGRGRRCQAGDCMAHALREHIGIGAHILVAGPGGGIVRSVDCTPVCPDLVYRARSCDRGIERHVGQPPVTGRLIGDAGDSSLYHFPVGQRVPVESGAADVGSDSVVLCGNRGVEDVRHRDAVIVAVIILINVQAVAACIVQESLPTIAGAFPRHTEERCPVACAGSQA